MKGHRPAIAGVVLGLVVGAALTTVAMLNKRDPDFVFGSISLGLAYLYPSLAAALAFRADHVRRAGIWIGAGVIGVFGSATSLTGLTLPLLPSGVLLLAGGIILYRSLMERSPARLVGVAATSALLAFGAFAVLWFFADAACWLQRPDGVWVEVPHQPVLTAPPGYLGVRCTSGTITGPGALMSALFGAALLAFAGLQLRVRRVATA